MEAMSTARRAACVSVSLAAACALGAAGCGGGGGTAPAPVRTAPTPAPGLDPAIMPPRRVPRQPTGAADPAAVGVIQAWAAAERHGDLRRAARFFALPSRFQNGTPVLTLRRRIDVLAILAGFSCGAVPTRFAGAGGYTLVRFRLTSRSGGDCRGAEGRTTGGAIRVAGGRIRAWYRLYDPEEITPGTDPNAVPL
jgi:hypothetical protein